jgi:hypothetical protein
MVGGSVEGGKADITAQFIEYEFLIPIIKFQGIVGREGTSKFHNFWSEWVPWG